METQHSLSRREHSLIGRGGETSAWKLKKKLEAGRSQRGLVLKSFEGYDGRKPGWQADRTRGFNQSVREYLQATHDRLQGQYGDAVLPCRIVQNPDETDRYFLVQLYADSESGNERLQLLLDQNLDDIQDAGLQRRIGKFADSLKNNYERWLRADKTAVVPDIEKANIVLDRKRQRFYYIDNGIMDTPYFARVEANRWDDLENVAARLEMMSGRSAEQILADPFYQKLFAKYGDQYPELQTAVIDNRAFYKILHQMGNDIRQAAIADFQQYMARGK